MNAMATATIVQLVQGSAEWLQYRLSMRNASEAAAVMGESPWMTPYQLWLLKTGRSTAKVTAAMRHGTALEPEARRAYEARSDCVMQPLVMRDGPYSASLDGITLDGDLLLEVKCPFQGRDSKLWQAAEQGHVPIHYQSQIQHQMMVSGASVGHLWVYAAGAGIVVEVSRDEAAIEKLRVAWEAFQECVDTDAAPPLQEGDTVQRSDAAWVAAASEYLARKADADAAADGLQAARDELCKLGQHARECGAGVSVTRYWKSGAINYKAVPALRGVDLAPYRGKPREEVRVIDQS